MCRSAPLCLKSLALAATFLVSGPLLEIARCQEPSRQASPITINDLYVEVGNKVPAFGGMFVDEAHDTLYVYLSPVERDGATRVEQALSEVFGAARPPGRLAVLLGQYTFLQLKEWHERVSPEVFAIPAAVSSGIDQRRNRLTVEVERSELIPIVEAGLEAEGVPREAVLIAQIPAAELEATLEESAAPEENNQTLRDYWRPLVGGIQISIGKRSGGERINFGECTLGFVAMRGEGRGIVTAGHCLPGDLDGVTVFQPRIGGGQAISPDGPGCCYVPPFFDKAQNPKCQYNNRKCRYSDSAFVNVIGEIKTSMGSLARPALNNGTKWNGADTFQIVSKAERGKIAVDMRVTRVGAFTGRVEGTVKDLCHDFGTDATKAFLCQLEVEWDKDAQVGDSGAPVFVITDPAKNQAQLVGIAWATRRGVSPIWNIEMTDELGPTLLACVPENKC